LPVMAPATTCSVEGSGKSSGKCGLRRSAHMGGVRELPPGTTVEQMVAILAFLVGRHPALRTRFLLDGDDQPCRQVLSSEGVVPLDVVDTDNDPAAVAEEIRLRYKETPFEYPNEWPVGTAVIRRRGPALTRWRCTAIWPPTRTA
jgi:hypothetical protein